MSGHYISSSHGIQPVKDESAKEEEEGEGRGFFLTDDEEDDGADEASELNQQYDESTETRPKLAAYDDKFERIHIDLAQVAAKVEALIEQSGCISPHAALASKRATALQAVPEVRKRRILFVGKSGAGKSSLTNAVLDKPNLAKAVGGGQGCTNVPTSYEGPFPEQEHPFGAKFVCFSINDIKKMLRGMLKDYTVWNFGDEDDFDKEEHPKLAQAATTAFTVFRQLFCNHADFASDSAGEEYLERYNEEDEDAEADFTEWCRELLNKYCGNRDKIDRFCQFETQKALLTFLDPYVASTSQPTEPCLWPLVQQVRVGIKDVEILRYFTIVDIPGLDDVIQIRAKAYEEQVQACDEIWVVAKSDRVTTDSTVDSILVKYGAVTPVTIICTAIDDNIDDELAHHLEREKQSIGKWRALHSEENSNFTAMKKQQGMVAKLRKQLDTTRTNGGYMPTSNSSKRRKVTPEELEMARTRAEKLENELRSSQELDLQLRQEKFELLVVARNTNTERKLIQKKAICVKQSLKLTTFFVSSTHYVALKGARDIQPPRLSAEGTGIPALRQHLYTIAAPLLLQAVEQVYMEQDFKVFLQNLRMLADPDKMKGCEVVLENVSAMQETVGPLLDEHLNKCQGLVEEVFSEPFKAHQDAFVKHALIIMAGKKAWNWQTLKAFAHRNGNHATSKQEYQQWNDQWMERAAAELKDLLPVLQERQVEYLRGFEDTLIDSARSILKTVASSQAAGVLDMDNIADLMEGHVNGIKNICKVFAEEAMKGFRNISIKASKEGETSYFTLAMQEAYLSAQDISGPTAKARMLQVFETHFQLKADRSPFAVMADSLAADVLATVKSSVTTLHAGFNGIIGDIRGELKAMLAERSDGVADAALRELLREQLPRFEVDFLDVWQDLKRIRRQYG